MESKWTWGSVRRLVKSIIFCAVLVLMLGALNFVMERSWGTGDGWADMAQTHGQVDVFAIGSSLTYCSISPMEMWRTRGITALDLTGESQRMPLTRAYLEQAISDNHPKVVLVDVGILGKQAGLLPASAHDNLDPMPWGLPRANAILTTMRPAYWEELFFPLSLYHSRWSELTRDDFMPDKYSQYSYARGATYWAKVVPVESGLPPDVLDQTAYEQDLVNVRAMARACDAKGVKMVLVESPTGQPIQVAGQPLEDRLRSDLSGEFPSLTYLNLNRMTAIGIDPKKDFLESNGHHLNFRGDVKTSRWLAGYLASTFGLADHRHDAFAAQWDAALQKYDEVFVNW
jgi:hypothetical protein